MDKIVSHVAETGEVSDWIALRASILALLTPDSNEDDIVDSSSNMAQSFDLSPSSTIHLERSDPSSFCPTVNEFIHFIREWILSLDSHPICTQRLCELLMSSHPLRMDDMRFLAQIERTISSSRPIRCINLIRRRSSEGSVASSTYTPSPKRRVLKRTRIVL